MPTLFPYTTLFRSRLHLGQMSSLGRKQEGASSPSRAFVDDRLPGRVEDINPQEHPLAASVGSLVHGSVLVGGKVANLGDAELHEPARRGLAQKAGLQGGLDQLGKKSEKSDGTEGNQLAGRITRGFRGRCVF